MFPTGFSLLQTYTVDHTKVSGTADHANIPVLLSDGNFIDATYAAVAQRELNSTGLLSDANLQAYYRMEGNSNDSAGSNNGTDTAITYSTGNGKFGQGAGFNGSSSGISVADDASLFGASMTHSFWVNPTALPTSGNIMGLISKRDNTGGTAGYLIQLFNNSGTQTIDIQSTNATGYSGRFNYTLPTSQWSFISIVLVNGSIPKLFVNSVEQIAATSASGSTTNYATPLEIGKRSDGFYFNGKIDDYGLFDRALSATEIKALYNGSSDLRFSSDQAGTTELASEIVSWDSTGKTAEVHVKFPTLKYNEDTTIYVWGNNPSATAYAPSDPFGSQNVWGDYKNVLHMEEGSGTILKDSSGNEDGSLSNSALWTTTTKIGSSALDFNAGDYHANAVTMGTVSNISLSFWLKRDVATPSVLERYIGVLNDSNNRLLLENSPTNTGIRENEQRNSGTSLAFLYNTTSTDWIYVTITSEKNNSTIIYANGTNVASGTPTNTDFVMGTSRMYLGALNNAGTAQSFTKSIINTFRYSENIISSDQIATEYNNQNSPSTFGTGAGLGVTLVADAGSFALTGIDVSFLSQYYMAAVAGSFTLTGIAAGLNKVLTLIADAGSFVLTGIAAILKGPFRWTNQTKNTTNWTEETKNTTNWTNLNKS